MTTSIKSGVAFHVHHDKLCGFVYNYDERIQYIKENKPSGEQPLRLARLKLIPDELLPSQDSPEWLAYGKARDAHDKAWDACEKAWLVFGKMWDAYFKSLDVRHNKALDAYVEARDARVKTWDAYVKTFDVEITNLHARLCLNCPWDGKTLFTRKDKDGNWY